MHGYKRFKHVLANNLFFKNQSQTSHLMSTNQIDSSRGSCDFEMNETDTSIPITLSEFKVTNDIACLLAATNDDAAIAPLCLQVCNQ